LKNYEYEKYDESQEPISQGDIEVYPKVKVKYDTPYYWAAYTMLDEI
jgi:CHAT domain-containing protein